MSMPAIERALIIAYNRLQAAIDLDKLFEREHTASKVTS
jgi:hypothetical protein